MNKTRCVVYLAVVALVVACCAPLAMVEEDTPTPPGDFAIYLPAEIQFAEGIAELENLVPADDPVLSVEDIVSYASVSHQIVIRPSAADRMDLLDLPGKPFIVTVGGQPVYAGEFMAAYFSRSSDRVVILWPPMTGDRLTIQIQLGYPGPDFFTGDDPRSDPLILESLRLAGVLK